MPDVTKRSRPSLDASTGMVADQIPALIAGEALSAVSPCHIQADGLAYLSVEGDPLDGFTPKAYTMGEPVTLFGKGTRFGYGSGLTPGALLYLSATPGRLSDAAVAVEAEPVAKAISASDIRIIRDA